MGKGDEPDSPLLSAGPLPNLSAIPRSTARPNLTAMLIQTLLLTTCLASPAKLEPAHAQNPVFSQVLNAGMEVGGQTITLPPPRHFDGQAADAERAALREVAGSDRAVGELLRDSVTAPYIIKVHDVKA